MSNINGLVPVLSNMGTKVALSALNTAPVAADILGEVESITGLNIKVNNIDTTSVSSVTGMSRMTPTYKVWGEATLTVFKDNANFAKIFNQFFGHNTAEAGFYCDLTISWPRLADWTDVFDIRLHGYLSGFNWSDVTRDDVQKITFNFQPAGGVETFYGFGSVTSLTADSITLPSTGGNVKFTVAGTGLINGNLVKGFIGAEPQALTIGYTTGTDTSQTVTIMYPANQTEEEKEYTVKVSLDGGLTYAAATATVTVAGVAAG